MKKVYSINLTVEIGDDTQWSDLPRDENGVRYDAGGSVFGVDDVGSSDVMEAVCTAKLGALSDVIFGDTNMTIKINRVLFGNITPEDESGLAIGPSFVWREDVGVRQVPIEAQEALSDLLRQKLSSHVKH